MWSLHSRRDTVEHFGSDSFNTAGQKVTYTFKVEKEGNYKIGMNYRQSEKTDFPVFTDIAIDGEIPNEAFRSYAMKYGAGYQQSTLQDSKGTRSDCSFDHQANIQFLIPSAWTTFVTSWRQLMRLCQR